MSGDSHIGAGVEIGTGAVILPGVQIGAGSIIGAGAVVTRDLPACIVAAGVPARVTRELDD
jgi:acetyltransferase-like isoleucine patch superfamily enzyme